MQSDVVMYASASVCLEALELGIPVIYMGGIDFFDADPLLECKGLNWRVQGPKTLEDAFQGIEEMSPKEFEMRRQKGRAYVRGYFSPMTERELQLFL